MAWSGKMVLLFGNLAGKTLIDPTCLSTDIKSNGLDINHGVVNQVDFRWDQTKETSVTFKVNTFSTEFSAVIHGRSGMPFQLMIQTYCDSEKAKWLHSLACQIKVYGVSHRGSGVGLWV